MKMLINAFAKKLFGVKYERLIKSILLCGIMYLGLHSSGYKLTIAPFFLYITSAFFTFGVMWQALNSKDSAEYIKNLIMMPFSSKSLTLAFIGTLGIYAIFTKTLMVWAIMFAVCEFDITTTLFSVIAAILSILTSTLIYVMVYVIKSRHNGAINHSEMDGYIFYDAAEAGESKKEMIKSHKSNLICTYLIRYLMAHKNYLINSVIIWGLACIIPTVVKTSSNDEIFQKMIFFIGFGLVSINTPLTILVSCDPDLDRGIRCLPSGAISFFVPYGVFLFVNVCIAYTIYIISWSLQIGGITTPHIIIGLILALVNSALSIVMEWFFPLKNWKIESDLWHHPRKYVVPGIIILLASLCNIITF